MHVYIWLAVETDFHFSGYKVSMATFVNTVKNINNARKDIMLSTMSKIVNIKFSASGISTPIYHTIFFNKISKYNCFNHFASLRYGKWSKFFCRKIRTIRPSQYNGCWYPGDSRSKCISSHGIDLPRGSSITRVSTSSYIGKMMTGDIVLKQVGLYLGWSWCNMFGPLISRLKISMVVYSYPVIPVRRNALESCHISCILYLITSIHIRSKSKKYHTL